MLIYFIDLSIYPSIVFMAFLIPMFTNVPEPVVSLVFVSSVAESSSL